MTTRAATFLPLVLAFAAITGSAASAAIPNPQSDAAMRKGVRDYVKYHHRVNDKAVKATAVRIDCVQAAKVGSTRSCSGTFSLTMAGRTAHYKLTEKAGTFRISPGAMEYHLKATATRKVAGLPSSVNWGGILQ